MGSLIYLLSRHGDVGYGFRQARFQDLLMRTILARLAIWRPLWWSAVLAAKRVNVTPWWTANAGPLCPPSELVLGAALVAARPQRKRAEEREAIFSNLGQRLSAVRTPKEAAQIILEEADALWPWDACVLNLYSPGRRAANTVLCIDTIAGRRTEILPEASAALLSPIARRALEEGPQLVLRPADTCFPVDVLPFGDADPASASLMYVPVRKDSEVIGCCPFKVTRRTPTPKRTWAPCKRWRTIAAARWTGFASEVALAESNERLRLALAAGKMGTWTRELDGQGRVIYSPELEAILRAPAGRVPGDGTGALRFHSPGRPRAWSGRRLTRPSRSKATTRWNSVSCRAAVPRAGCWDAGGSITMPPASRSASRGWPLTSRTAKWRSRKSRRLNAELEHRVLERTAQLDGDQPGA